MNDALDALSSHDPTWLDEEHARLMRGTRGDLPWSKHTAHRLDAATRATLATVWRARADAERRSAPIFATWLVDLTGAGADARVLSVTARAVLDEVRHAELFEDLARAYGAPERAPSTALPVMPDDPEVPLRWQAAREALSLSVVAETFSLAMLHALRDAAGDPLVRAVRARVVGDESLHARLGWTLLAQWIPHDDGLRAYLAAHAPSVLADYVAMVFGDPEALPDEAYDARLAAHGVLPQRTLWTLFETVYRTLWRPTFVRWGATLPEGVPRRSAQRGA